MSREAPQRGTRAGPVRATGPTSARGLLPLGALLIAWQVLGRDDSRALPPPDRWASALAELYFEGRLVAALTSTLVTFSLALACATLVGAVLGLAVGASGRIDRALAPSLDFVASMPGAAVVPLAVLLLGTTRLTSVVIVVLAVVWPILLNTAMALRTIPPVRLEMSRTLGLGPGRRWAAVVLPSASPAILLGARVAASMALIVTLLVDILGTGDGVGRLLVESQQRFDTAAAWGLVLIMGTFGYLTSTTLGWLERRLLRHWPPHLETR